MYNVFQGVNKTRMRPELYVSIKVSCKGFNVVYIVMKLKVKISLFLMILVPVVSAQNILTLEQAMTRALSKNYDILLAQTVADIDKTNNTAGNAGMLPGIAINATDNYSKINLEQQFLNGTNIRQSKVAQLQYDAASYDLEAISLKLRIQLENAISDFEYQNQLLKLELDNDALAKENPEISLQRLRLGQTTELEVKLAQESFVESRTRLINLMYNVKVAETKIKQLMAEL
jgi:outer membrane protein TolC